jgi:3-hydroxybutyryl-CoA dehydrogenase
MQWEAWESDLPSLPLFRNGIGDDVRDAESVKRVLVIGSGLMGSSIAQVFATAGIGVRLVDVEEKALARATGLIEAGLHSLAEAGMLDEASIPSIISRVIPSTDLSRSAEGVDFVVEVVPEIPELKKKIFSQLSDLLPKETVIASNTSALDIFSIADLQAPERLVITHFFAPAYIVPLVEIVPGPKTSQETVSFAAALMSKVGKSPVVMKRFGPGFIVNRLQKAIGEAALEMIEEGLADPEEIDRAVKYSLGVRLPVVGVVQTFDFQGLDMLLLTMKNYGKVIAFVEDKVNRGYLGAKTSRGIYDYQGRSEIEILRKRDALYLKMLKHLKAIGAFEPV